MPNNSPPNEADDLEADDLEADDLEADDLTVHAGSGNVFADMGMPDAEELIAERSLSQAQAAVVMGLNQTDIADIVRGRLKGYTLDRLFQCLTALDQDIEIVIRPRQDAARQARVLVTRL